MKTDALIDFLAKGADVEPTPVASRRLLLAGAIGGSLSLVIALALIGPLPAQAFLTPSPWMKFAYTLALLAATSLLVLKLARPLANLDGPIRWLGLILFVMLALGAWNIWQTPSDSRLPMLLGQTWLLCPWLVLLVSLPSLVAVQLALRALAPVQLIKAGFACGVLAGTMGATAYAIACPEDAPAFVAVWYTLGILLTGALGAVTGRWLLRWQ
jgi:hypothetical protein